MKFVVPQESDTSPTSFLDRCGQETPPADFYLPRSLLRSQHPAWHNTAHADPPSHSEVSDSARFTTQHSQNLLPPTSPAGSYSNFGKKLETVQKYMDRRIDHNEKRRPFYSKALVLINNTPFNKFTKQNTLGFSLCHLNPFISVRYGLQVGRSKKKK